jgi:hypothetical protein
MRQLLNQLGELWCTTMHTSVMWPIRGRYQCSTCHREYAVSFEKAAEDQSAPRQTGFNRALLWRA